MEIKEKPAKPQISPELFRKITPNTELDRGCYLYEMLDQKESHWQFKRYILKGICNRGLILTDDRGTNCIKNPFKLHIYLGHL